MNQLSTSDIQPISFEVNILLSGVLAKLYSETDYHSPIQNWAWDIPNRELILNDTRYRAAPSRAVLDGVEVNGVQMTVENTQGQCHYFFPIEQLRKVLLSVNGFKLK